MHALNVTRVTAACSINCVVLCRHYLCEWYMYFLRY